MIHSIYLKNFKCFSEQRFDLAPLTLLTGLNGMGKSSIIQALLLLRQSYQDGLLRSGLELNGRLVELGTGRDVFYENAKDNEMILGLEIGNGIEDNAGTLTSPRASALWRFL